MCANTLEIDGILKKKRNTTTELSVSINPNKTFTEYTQQQILVAAAGTESVSLGGLSYPKLLYIETDNAVKFKCYRGASVIASAVPIDTSFLLMANDANRYGTVSITNSGASEADVKIYACG